MQRPILIGIAGGSGSGKTWLAETILSHFGSATASLLSQDWYYRDLSHLDPECAAQTNFDQPDALEFELLERHLDALQTGKQVEAPQYAFNTFSRLPGTRRIAPAPLIVVEGLFILQQPDIRRRLDIAVYVSTPEALRRQRRIERDLAERGYDRERIHDFWTHRAVPMHARFVKPSRAVADRVWDSVEDRAFVPAFLADLEVRLASHGDEEHSERQGLD